MLSKCENQPCQGENRATLENVENDRFILSEYAQTRRCPNGSENWETARRCNCREQGAGATDAVEKNETTFHEQL